MGSQRVRQDRVTFSFIFFTASRAVLSAESFCQPVPEPASGLRDSQTHNKNIVKRNKGVKLDLTGQDWTLRFKPPVWFHGARALPSVVCVGVTPGAQTLLRHQAHPTQSPCYTRRHVHHLPTLASRKGFIFYLLLGFITRKEHLKAVSRCAFGICKMLMISSEAFSSKESHTRQKHNGPRLASVHSACSSLPAHPWLVQRSSGHFIRNK